MQINGNIHHIEVFLTILGIMILSFIVILSNNAFGQGTLHNHTIYEMVNQSSGLDENPQIDVGILPSAIRSEENLGKAFVANSDSNTVSVLSMDNNTKIKDIPVGNNPTAIGIDEFSGTVYVANSDSNTVSVIDGKNDTKIGEDIPVGNYPIAIEIDEFSDTVYVANSDSNGISVIDGTAHKAVAGIILEVNPLDSGYIVCDGLTPPSSMEQYIYVWSSAECIAKPNEGFEFVSWEQNLGNNSTQLINVSRSASTLDSFVLGIQDLFGDKPEEPEAKLNVAKFGTFTANFKELPPPVPREFWLQSYVLVGTVIAGLSIPSVVVFITSKRDAKKLNYYHKQIASLYGDGRLDKGDLEPLDRLRSIVANAYSEGKLNEKHYESLEGEISTLYEEIFRKKIAALDSNNNYSVVKKPMQEQLAQIRNEVEYAFSMGKINEKHYDLLIKIIANLDSNER